MMDKQYSLVFAGMCAGIACSIAFTQIYFHLRNYTQPNFQRYILRLVFMVPLYSISSWLSLLRRDEQIYFATIRDCYEAWVIYNFLALCLAYVGGPGQVVLAMEGHSVQRSWLYGTCCFPPLPINGQFLRHCKQGALQFVILKPILAALVLWLESSDMYGEDSGSMNKGFIYIVAVYNLSYTVALYSLLLFYFGAKELLAATSGAAGITVLLAGVLEAPVVAAQSVSQLLGAFHFAPGCQSGGRLPRLRVSS
ncbi:hypothetical protein CYMTET_31551 [Cymbomonas tetramitiformis]|uniref:Uncharacterized protein n=1 Tax=Cymbomonas tetramitiformis TaxID=36881 RepID=A0AAE0FH18_9CHLO|nr:hypothetical protein CYMTET_31551 [Cymbomonas tetramitiformis]